MLTSAPSSARIGRQDAAAAKGCAAVQRAFVVAALSSFPCTHIAPPPLRRPTPDPPPAAAAAATTNRTQINLVIFFVLVLQIKLQN